MNLSPEIEDRINRIESLEAKRTRLLLALTDCEHANHYPRFYAEIAETLRASIGETMQLLIDFQELSCDAVDWPRELPAIRRP
jgi:hypothetical protein